MKNMNRLLLNKSIYSGVTIDKAIMAFRHLAVIKRAADGDYHVLTFDKCMHDIAITKAEFENYLINSMVSRNG